MESNGAPGRIHCSEATAEALRSRGKGHWLTPREDEIVVKGKGEMQTYCKYSGSCFFMLRNRNAKKQSLVCLTNIRIDVLYRG